LAWLGKIYLLKIAFELTVSPFWGGYFIYGLNGSFDED